MMGMVLLLTLGAESALASPANIGNFTGKVNETFIKKGEAYYLAWPNSTKKISSAKESRW